MIHIPSIFTFTASFLFAAPSVFSQEAVDSVTVNHELQEFVVIGERSWIEGNKAIFIPTKQEKNLANDPASLIQRMKIPMLVVEQGQIKNMRGETIPVYINGEPADNIDISTFWGKQTNKVEYIDHPEDPKFRGATAVVNIIMPEYKVGGVTKINANQDIPGGGNYNVASKLVYKKMTYGLLAGGKYRRDHSSTYKGNEVYDNIYYDGTLYDKITRDFSGHSWHRSEGFNVALNARYRTDKTRVVNTLTLTHNNNPGSGSEDADSWTPSLFNSHSSRSENNSHSLSPQLSGEWVQTFSSKISTVLGWKYAYMHNNTHSLYQNGDLSPILNSTREDVHSAALNHTTSYMLKPNMAFWLQLASSMDWYDTQYGGSSDAHQRQWRGQTSAKVSFRYALSDKLFLSVDPGLIVDYWHLNGVADTHSTVKPSASLNAQWAINRRSSLSGDVWYWSRQPEASQSGDVILRQDELTWIKANPLLKGQNIWSASLYYSYMPVRMFNFSAILGYHRDENNIITKYDRANADMGGIIKTYINGSPENSYTLDMIMNLRLFGEKLNIHLQPVFGYQDIGGIYANHLFHSRLRTSVSYDLGNFSMNVYHSTPQKWLANNGMTTSWSAQQLNLGLTYGNGDIYAHLSVDNILNAKYKTKDNTNAGCYATSRTSWSVGRQVSLSVSYTFGYGKRVERNIDINSGSEIKSGALK